MELSALHFRFYSGVYQLEKVQLENVRNYISLNLEEFGSLLKDKTFKRYFGTVRVDQNKRLPKEFAEVQKQQPLIANKQFYYFTELSPDKILSKSLSNTVMKFYFAAKPMNSFFKRALKQKSSVKQN
jgi:uncharacterized protein (DUF2461 family)